MVAKNMIEGSSIDRAALLMLTIREVRAEHSACTMREVARRLRTSPMIVHRGCEALRKRGYVDWTTLDGSLHLTSKGGKAIGQIQAGKLTELPEVS